MWQLRRLRRLRRRLRRLLYRGWTPPRLLVLAERLHHHPPRRDRDYDHGTANDNNATACVKAGLQGNGRPLVCVPPRNGSG